MTARLSEESRIPSRYSRHRPTRATADNSHKLIIYETTHNGLLVFGGSALTAGWIAYLSFDIVGFSGRVLESQS